MLFFIEAIFMYFYTSFGCITFISMMLILSKACLILFLIFMFSAVKIYSTYNSKQIRVADDQISYFNLGTTNSSQSNISSNINKLPPIRIPDEQSVFDRILYNYKTSARPISTHKSQIRVYFTVKLNQIIDMDERHQILTTSLLLDQVWHDEYLQWNNTEFGRVRTLRISADKVWLPDTFVFNNADEDSSGFLKGVYVLVKSNGQVNWPVPIKLKTTCKVDITFFPFDDQICEIRFGSWSYKQSSLEYVIRDPDLKMNEQSSHSRSSHSPIDLSGYTDNSDWLLIAANFVNVSRMSLDNDTDADEHSSFTSSLINNQHDLVMTLHMRRRSFFYMWNIIVPCFMLTLLTQLTFWTPVDTGEKISLGLSVFLALYMFMMLIAQQVPPTSESVPLIGLYLILVMLMTAISILMAIFVVNLHSRGEKFRRAPGWVRKLFLHSLAKCFALEHDVYAAAKRIQLVKKLKSKQAAKHSRLEHQIKAIKRWKNLLDLFYYSCGVKPPKLHTVQQGKKCQCCSSTEILWERRDKLSKAPTTNIPIHKSSSFPFLKKEKRKTRLKEKTTFAPVTICNIDVNEIPNFSPTSKCSHSSASTQDYEFGSVTAKTKDITPCACSVYQSLQDKRRDSTSIILENQMSQSLTSNRSSTDLFEPESRKQFEEHSSGVSTSFIKKDFRTFSPCSFPNSTTTETWNQSHRRESPDGMEDPPLVWLTRGNFSTSQPKLSHCTYNKVKLTRQRPRTSQTSDNTKFPPTKSNTELQTLIDRQCRTRESIKRRRRTMALGVDEHMLLVIEWEMIASVVDKCMFCVSFLATATIYAILFFLPRLVTSHVEHSDLYSL